LGFYTLRFVFQKICLTTVPGERALTVLADV